MRFVWGHNARRGLRRPNEVRVEGDVAHVRLSRGLVALIDASDLDLVAGFRWWAQRSATCRSYYAVASRPMVRGTRPGNLAMHRLLLGVEDTTVQVDHRNNDGLDNRRANLRIGNHHLNRFNTPRQRNNTSGYIGVGWHRASEGWRAYLGKNGRQLHLGRFDSAEDAAHARDYAARQHFGSFAKLNFPLENEGV